MGGKMKIVGNIMSTQVSVQESRRALKYTQKLDPVLKELKGKAKL